MDNSGGNVENEREVIGGPSIPLIGTPEQGLLGFHGDPDQPGFDN